MGNKLKYIVLIMFLFLGTLSFAQDPKKFPIPTGNPNQLFFLQRTANSNTLVYELNYKNGELVADEPVHVFWIRYSEKGQREELNYVQRNFAYGVKSKLVGKDSYELHFVSYKKRILYLKKSTDNKFYIYTVINKKQVMLHQIYLHIVGGAFWTPNIEYVELKGFDPATGLDVTERVKV